MSNPPWKHLDPGVVEIVRLLHSAGFETTDSGDGVSKPDVGRVFEFPHVFCRVDRDDLVDASDRALRILRDAGLAGWSVEASYNPADEVAILFCADYEVES